MVQSAGEPVAVGHGGATPTRFTVQVSFCLIILKIILSVSRKGPRSLEDRPGLRESEEATDYSATQRIPRASSKNIEKTNLTTSLCLPTLQHDVRTLPAKIAWTAPAGR